MEKDKMPWQLKLNWFDLDSASNRKDNHPSRRQTQNNLSGRRCNNFCCSNNPDMKKKIPNYVNIVISLTLINLAILAIRNLIVGDTVFNFLLSNLFIGSFPALLIAFLIDRYYEKLNNLSFLAASALWVLFYPNAPYMISDLIHNVTLPDLIFKEQRIFDTIIIFSIAMLSVFYGFLSLKIMFVMFKRKYGGRFAHSAIFVTVALSCLGFYMGRELISTIKLGNGYMYSWEIFLEPIYIIQTTWNALWPIAENWQAYAMMALFGLVQYMLLIMFKDVNDIEGAGLVTKHQLSGNE